MPTQVIVDEHNQDEMSRLAGIYVYTGAKLWLEGDRLHHMDGPALVSPDGAVRWYVGGKEVTRDVSTFFHQNKWPVAQGLDSQDKRTSFAAHFGP
jgi:hypothetical protein